MKRIIKYFLALVLTLFFVGQSYASCTRNHDVAEQNIYQNMGTIVVSPNLKVGDIIAQKSWPISAVGKAFQCTGGDQFWASINTALLGNESSKIHHTNVPGVGMKITRITTQEYVYPFIFNAPSTTDYNIVAGQFIVTLYKTDENVGSGSLTSGLYSWYSPSGTGESESVINSYISENGTIIVSPSCSVASGAQQNVYLEPINYNQLKTVGSTVGDSPFSIQLKCSGGASLNVGYDNVNFTFTGTTPDTLSNSDGVLINDVESTGAQGVGIQVLDDKKQSLIFDNKYNVASLTGAQSGYYVVTDYIARYYRYGNSINPGTVEAKMVFGITYD